MIETLLENGVNVDSQNMDGKTALYISSELGISFQQKCVQFIAIQFY